MKTMWAPWRMEYILGDKENGCIFCKALSEQDNLTLYKGKATLVLMNKFPYINGHLLVAPIKHISTLDQLSKSEMGDLLKTVEQSVGILKKVMNPDGFNVGLNLGSLGSALWSEEPLCNDSTSFFSAAISSSWEVAAAFKFFIVLFDLNRSERLIK